MITCAGLQNLTSDTVIDLVSHIELVRKLGPMQLHRLPGRWITVEVIQNRLGLRPDGGCRQHHQTNSRGQPIHDSGLSRRLRASDTRAFVNRLVGLVFFSSLLFRIGYQSPSLAWALNGAGFLSLNLRLFRSVRQA